MTSAYYYCTTTDFGPSFTRADGGFYRGNKASASGLDPEGEADT
jgi:hypothetical protein